MITNEELKTQIEELHIAGKQSFLYGDHMLKAADSIEELAQELELEKECSAFWKEQANFFLSLYLRNLQGEDGR